MLTSKDKQKSLYNQSEVATILKVNQSSFLIWIKKLEEELGLYSPYRAGASRLFTQRTIDSMRFFFAFSQEEKRVWINREKARRLRDEAIQEIKDGFTDVVLPTPSDLPVEPIEPNMEEVNELEETEQI